jgi:hypothetical protein
MVLQLSWTIEGETQLSRKLLTLSADLKDYTRPFSDSAFYLKSVFSKDVFETQGAAIGEQWKRLSPYTVAQKARQGYPAQPLVRTGAMQSGFQSIVSSDQAVIYNTADYFKYHQSNQPRSKLPRRVMMKIAENQREQIIKYFQQYIQDSLRK